MYDERNRFNVRNLLMQILIILLFIFILIWLFPTKKYMDDKYITKDELILKLESIYGRNFASNVETMRDAAKDYFTAERLPKNIGDSVTLTLGEMLNKKLVMEFTDSNGEKCSVTQSYVKLTKMETEYQLKVQLTCSDYADYIIDYIGCYAYCDNCDKQTTTVKPSNPSKPTNKPTDNKPTDNKPDTKDPEPTPEPVVKKYKYEYRLVTQNTYSNWSDWSNWSTTKAVANVLTQVEIKKDQVVSGYKQNYVQTGTKTETYTDYVDETYTEYVDKTYTDYETKTERVPSGTKRVLVDSRDVDYEDGYYGSWHSAGNESSESMLYSSDTVKYTLDSTDRYLDCTNKCRYVTVYYYSVEEREWHEGGTSCPSGYVEEGSKCNKYANETTYEDRTSYEEVTKTEKVPVTKTRKVAVTKTREVPVYGYVNGDPIYKTVTYYRFRTRTKLTEAGVVYKWSESKEDATLLSLGYKLTGNIEEV